MGGIVKSYVRFKRAWKDLTIDPLNMEKTFVRKARRSLHEGLRAAPSSTTGVQCSSAATTRLRSRVTLSGSQTN